jgi:hypothetical protein
MTQVMLMTPQDELKYFEACWANLSDGDTRCVVLVNDVWYYTLTTALFQMRDSEAHYYAILHLLVTLPFFGAKSFLEFLFSETYNLIK